ncbi:MAG: GntR family transcriptional regulator [Clostridiaceae bacterium]|nr:GntR family transcriptional regulator [Clostridiaceae bacterium]
MGVTLSDKVYDAVKEDINNARLSSDAFLVESQVAKRYGVSKAPVREALHRLCREGRLISYPRKGYLIVSLSETEFFQTQQLRLVNEGFAVKYLVNNSSKEDIKILREFAQKNDISGNRDFHSKLAELTGNNFLKEIVTHLLDVSIRTLNVKSSSESGEMLKNYHFELIDSIVKHDEEKALEYLKMDLELGNSSFSK